MEFQRKPEEVRHHLLGKVVPGGTEAAGSDDASGPGQRLRDRIPERGRVVRHRRTPNDAHAGTGQGLPRETAALVSTVKPSRSSVPMVMSSRFTGAG
jgi:hypothetical protein